jgi:rhodanese-related sulfurtransferase
LQHLTVAPFCFAAGTLLQIERRFPDKQNAKLLVACGNGTQYSIDALEALDEAGYVNLVGLKGGYRSWFR